MLSDKQSVLVRVERGSEEIGPRVDSVGHSFYRYTGINWLI